MYECFREVYMGNSGWTKDKLEMAKKSEHYEQRIQTGCLLILTALGIAGARMVIHTRRYANVPTFTFPWDRVPVVEIE